MTGRTSATVAASAVPVLVGAVGVVLALAWRSDLPDRIPQQWNDSGVSSTTTVPGTVGYLVAVSVTAAVFCGWVVARSRTPRTAAVSAAGGIALSTFVTGSMVGLLAAQRGTTAAAEGPPLGWILAAAVAAVGAGLLGAGVVEAMLSRIGATADSAASTEVSSASATTSSVYVRTVVNWYMVSALVILSAILLVLAFAQGNFVLGITAVIVLSTVPLSVWRVLVNADQIHVFSLARLGSRKISMSTVDSVELTAVRPVRDFGGYGLRTSPTATGVIVTSGDAITIGTHSGSDTVVTLPRAAEAVHAINGIRNRTGQ